VDTGSLEENASKQEVEPRFDSIETGLNPLKPRGIDAERRMLALASGRIELFAEPCRRHFNDSAAFYFSLNTAKWNLEVLFNRKIAAFCCLPSRVDGRCNTSPPCSSQPDMATTCL
jgi:hypothetical protein